MHLVLIGPPGAGKGTQAALLAERHALVPIGTGNLIRTEINRVPITARGVRCRIVEDGHMAPPADVESLMLEALQSPAVARGALFDGAVRSLAQAQGLDRQLALAGHQLSAALVFTVPEAELVARGLARTVCPTCQQPYAHRALGAACDRCTVTLVRRPEDEPEPQRRRFALYTADLHTIVTYYETTERPTPVIAIDGVGAPEQVYRRIHDGLAAAGVSWGGVARWPQPMTLARPSQHPRGRRAGR